MKPHFKIWKTPVSLCNKNNSCIIICSKPRKTSMKISNECTTSSPQSSERTREKSLLATGILIKTMFDQIVIKWEIKILTVPNNYFLKRAEYPSVRLYRTIVINFSFQNNTLTFYIYGKLVKYLIFLRVENCNFRFESAFWTWFLVVSFLLIHFLYRFGEVFFIWLLDLIEKSQWKNYNNEHTSHHYSSINKSIIKKS